MKNRTFRQWLSRPRRRRHGVSRLFALGTAVVASGAITTASANAQTPVPSTGRAVVSPSQAGAIEFDIPDAGLTCKALPRRILNPGAPVRTQQLHPTTAALHESALKRFVVLLAGIPSWLLRHSLPRLR
jgi:hypothetical protein